MNLVEKGKLIGKAYLHSLLNRAVNTPDTVAQLVRDLEAAMSDLAGSVAEAQGNVTGTERDIAQLKSRRQELESDADLLMTDEDPTNDVSAVQLQAKADDAGRQIESLEAQLVESKALRDTLTDTMSKLRSKHDEMLVQYRQLRVLDTGAKAKEKAAAAVMAAGGAMGDDSADNVDNVSRAIQARADAADARLNYAVGTLQSAGGQAEEDVRLAKAKRALLARQQKVTDAALAQADSPAGTPAS